MSRPSDLRQHNRRHMPTVARVVEEMRRHFPDLTVEYAEENGYVLGIVREYDEPTRSALHGCFVAKQLSETNVGPRAIPAADLKARMVRIHGEGK
jgi:hypothetical protein